MMKRKWIWVIILCFVLCLGLAGCSGYTSSYSATVLITENTSNSASISFSTMKGSKVLQMKTKEEGKTLEYFGSLAEGKVTVYYDEDGSKKELFTISGGEKAESSVKLNSKGKLYVIVETDGKCETGRFQFEIK